MRQNLEYYFFWKVSTTIVITQGNIIGVVETMAPSQGIS